MLWAVIGLVATSVTSRASTTTSVGQPTCSTDEDCSLLGICHRDTGKCLCDAGWTGQDCGELKLLPVERGSGYNLTGAKPPVSSWGANIFPAGRNEDEWHMYAAEFENNCDISKWSPNSAIVHAVSVTGPTGPYARKDVAVPPFAHNPKVVQAPDGTWLMYTIGVPVDAGKLANCSTDTVTGAKLSQRAEAGKSNAAPSPPGRTPGNLESNVTLFTARSIAGPWTRFGVVLGPDWEGTWDEDTSNPSPLVLPNGTVLLMYRGCVVGGGGCHSEYIGIASASNWRGPYTRLGSQSILPNSSAEDPSLWIDRRGNFHFLMHYLGPNSGELVARHAFSRSYTGPWDIHVKTIPYTTTVEFTDGSSTLYHKRERPHLVFNKDAVPVFLVTGVVAPGNQSGYAGLSYTLIQGVRSH